MEPRRGPDITGPPAINYSGAQVFAKHEICAKTEHPYSEGPDAHIVVKPDDDALFKA